MALVGFARGRLDTVKVRMQGQGSPPRYVGLRQTAWTIVREEGFFRGLYSGTPMEGARLGSGASR